MVRILVCYFSGSGNTQKMAEFIAEGVGAEGVDVDVRNVENVNCDELLDFDGIILGSPTYYGTCAAPIKELIDESVKHHGKLDGKVGGAFSSSANIAGGNETTIMNILQMLMIHGMIVKGHPNGSHYGPVAVGAPDKNAEDECIAYGRSMAKLTKKITGE
ncbi:MAG: NAD(P)H-dependent oxidoreductase [Methanomassiliicoccales archaeon]|nr:MAG: NAD(P)H-dependent oxidoreductase [Methanomassiliicoccales archaeon]